MEGPQACARLGAVSSPAQNDFSEALLTLQKMAGQAVLATCGSGHPRQLVWAAQAPFPPGHNLPATGQSKCVGHTNPLSPTSVWQRTGRHHPELGTSDAPGVGVSSVGFPSLREAPKG